MANKEFVAGFQPILPAPMSPEQASQDTRFTPDPPSVISSGPLSQPSRPTIGQAYRAANQWLAGFRDPLTRGLETALSGGPARQASQGPLGTMGARLGANVINPVPGSLPQAAMMAVNPLIALGPGGMMRKAAMSGGANAMLGGLEGGVPGAVVGGTLGTLTGGASGVVSKFGQPNAATRGLLGAGRGIEEYATPAVSKVVSGYQKNPALLTESKTILKMHKAASQNIQTIVDEVTRLAPEGQISLPRLDPSTAIKLKLPMTQSPIPGGGMYPMGTFTELDKVRRLLRQQGDPQWRYVEQTMMDYADHVGLLGKPYKAALNAYRTDMRMIDYVEAIQKIRELPGGINPTDFPSLVGPSQSMFGSKGGGSDPAMVTYHTIRGLSLGPTSPWGIGHLGAAASTLARGSQSAPIAHQPIRVPGPLQKAMGKVGAATISEIPAQVTPTSPKVP